MRFNLGVRKSVLMNGCAVVAMAFCSAAFAQESAESSSASAGLVSEELVVTGSRIVRNGSEAPVPVTVTTAQDLFEARPSSIVDALNTLPQFKGSKSPNQTAYNAPVDTNLGNLLNLRGLGSSRSIILLDGVRVPPTTSSGAVDIDTLPQAFIERVEVVTGGVSAVYGSDAVVGAVNFILDKDYTGVKGTVQSGISKYGDAHSRKVSLAGGTGFMDGRFHVLASVDYYRNFGVPFVEDRPDFAGWKSIIGSGTAAVPFRRYDNVRANYTSPSGLIASGPLAGRVFNPDGTTRPFDKGLPTNLPTISIGGDGLGLVGAKLIPPSETVQTFVRGSYEVTEKISSYVQVSYGRSETTARQLPSIQLPGTGSLLTIFNDNAYLAPSTIAAMGQSLTMGRVDNTLPYTNTRYRAPSINIRAGLEGSFENSWKWDATYAFGNAQLKVRSREPNNLNFAAAADAVLDPATGSIVCRVALTNPGVYPGCSPINVFGIRTHSPAAIDFIYDDATYQVVNKMHIFNANIGGEVFDLPAGPVSVSAGVEYRHQTLNQTSNSNPLTPPAAPGLRGLPAGALTFQQTNVGFASGSVNVKEIYGETLVPILADKPFVKSFDITGAFRYTDYSTSGGVETWKAGVSYAPISDLRLRATLSQDIAAPNLFQLFSSAQPRLGGFTDVHTNIVAAVVSESSGNLNLKPEKGKMAVLGLVYQPSWLPNFTVSLDHYNLLIKDAISNTTTTQLNLDCELSNGTSPLCANISRPFPFSNRGPENFPTKIVIGPVNQAKTFSAGFDLEVGYNFKLDSVVNLPGTIELRALGTYIKDQQVKATANSATVEAAGSFFNDVPYPKYSGSIEASYRNGPLGITLTERFTGSVKAHPTSIYAEFGHLPNRTYTDVMTSYKFGQDENYEAFFSVQNLFNVKPYITGSGSNPGLTEPTNRQLYDIIGAYFTAGLKFKF